MKLTIYNGQVLKRQDGILFKVVNTIADNVTLQSDSGSKWHMDFDELFVRLCKRELTLIVDGIDEDLEDYEDEIHEKKYIQSSSTDNDDNDMELAHH